MSTITETIKHNKGITVAIGGTITTIIAILTYLNSSFVSNDKYNGHSEAFAKHITEIRADHNTRTNAIDSVANKLRQEMKQSRIEKLLWDKKLLIAKGQANLSEYDKTVIQLIDAEISTLNGRM